MPDPTPYPNPSPAPPSPEPPRPKRSRSAMNKAHLVELQNAGEIVNAALKPECAPLLAKRKIKAEDLTALQEDIRAARKQAGAATEKTATKEGATEAETGFKAALVRLLQDVQKAAKQKATRSGNGTLLKKYGVGSQFYSSRSILEQTAANFMASALEDDLPGIDQEAIDKIEAALDAYQKVQTDQTDAQSGATTQRATLEVAVADIARRRREIQFAADALWPAENKANAGIRKEFGLPPNKALK